MGGGGGERDALAGIGFKFGLMDSFDDVSILFYFFLKWCEVISREERREREEGRRKKERENEVRRGEERRKLLGESIFRIG